MRFAQGCYPNEVTCTLQEKGALRFGLKCDTYRGDCWCCFDNFELYFQALPEIYDGLHLPSATASPDTYDLQGRKLPASARPGKAGSDGVSILIKGGKKIAVGQ